MQNTCIWQSRAHLCCTTIQNSSTLFNMLYVFIIALYGKVLRQRHWHNFAYIVHTYIYIIYIYISMDSNMSHVEARSQRSRSLDLLLLHKSKRLAVQTPRKAGASRAMKITWHCVNAKRKSPETKLLSNNLSNRKPPTTKQSPGIDTVGKCAQVAQVWCAIGPRPTFGVLHQLQMLQPPRSEFGMKLKAAKSLCRNSGCAR